MNSSGFVTALRAEFFVLRRSAGPWLLVLLPAFALLLRLGLARLSSGGEADGYGFLVDGLSTGLALLYLLFIGYAAYGFASERDSGVLRHLLIRRVSRRALICAKLLVLHALALLSLLALLLCGWLLATALWELGPVVEDGFEIIGEAAIREEIRRGLLLAILPLPACLALGLLISVLARSAAQALALALGLALLLDVFKGALGDGAHYVFASFQPSLLDQSYLADVARIVRGYSDVLIDPAILQLNLWLPLPQALALFALALLLIVRRRL